MVEEYPRNLTELEANFGNDEVVSGILGATAVANGFRVSALRIGEGLAGARSVGVWQVWLSNFGDRRGDFSRYANPFAGVVPGHVVGDDPEERCQRIGSATRARAEEIRDGLDVAAQPIEDPRKGGPLPFQSNRLGLRNSPRFAGVVRSLSGGARRLQRHGTSNRPNRL